MKTAGIDIGSTTTKAVILEGERGMIGSAVMPTGGNNRITAEKVFHEALSRANTTSGEVDHICATGYGRDNVSFADRQVTEITCHATGIHALFPETRTIVDIGGQDTKSIQIDDAGRVVNFVMNDKCAAGTGRFLGVMANALGVQVEELGNLSGQSNSAVKISSMCTVFAESEVVSLVAKGTPVQDIIRGIHNAIATRSVILLKKLNTSEPVAMSGGVANNKGMVSCLEEKLKLKIDIPEHPQIVGALGAAILARNNVKAR